MGLFRYPKRKLKKLLKEGEYKKAVEFGTSIESDFTDDPDYMFIMGSIFTIIEKPEKAISYFEKALQLKHDDIETLTLKTNAHLALKQKEKAVECCKQILKIQPKNSEAQNLLEELESI